MDTSTYGTPMAFAPPSAMHWLGTDALGQPTLAVLMKSTALTVFDVVAAATLALALAFLVATLGSVFRHYLANFVFMVSSTFSFSTPLIAVLLLLYSIYGDSPIVFPLAAGSLLWGGAALILQTAISQAWRSNYIRAARSLGLPRGRLICLHLMPNILPFLRAAWISNWPAMLSASVLAAYLGAHGGSPRLGSLLKTGYELFPAAWWLWLPPTAVVCATFTLVFVLTDCADVRMGKK